MSIGFIFRAGEARKVFDIIRMNGAVVHEIWDTYPVRGKQDLSL